MKIEKNSIQIAVWGLAIISIVLALSSFGIIGFELGPTLQGLILLTLSMVALSEVGFKNITQLSKAGTDKAIVTFIAVTGLLLSFITMMSITIGPQLEGLLGFIYFILGTAVIVELYK